MAASKTASKPKLSCTRAMRRGCKAEAVVVFKGVRDREGAWRIEWDALHWTGEDSDLPAGFADTIAGLLCRSVAESYLGDLAVSAGTKLLSNLMKGRGGNNDGNGSTNHT